MERILHLPTDDGPRDEGTLLRSRPESLQSYDVSGRLSMHARPHYSLQRIAACGGIEPSTLASEVRQYI